ncbi:MAG TPA: hypothetical protein VG028_22370 [Terriglobia bacterium]|nr:hypothetical protein [Terriglobia bacterium]
MGVLAGGLILLVVGLVLRHALRIGARPGARAGHPDYLNPGQLALYTSFSNELETQVAIISVSLNDAFEERDSGRYENAWHLVKISAGEWQRVTEILTALLDAIQKNLAKAQALIPYRGMVARRFQSRTMVDLLRMYEFLDQLLFRSRARFHLQVHMLRKAAASLTREFARTFEYGERTQDRPAELWQRLDIYSHDFDLVNKEALMAFRAFLVSLSPANLERFAAELESVLRREARPASLSADL